MTNEHLLARFEAEHMAANSITPQRRLDQLALLRAFAETLGERGLIEMNASDVVRFLADGVAAGKHPNTMRKFHGMIRAFQTWAFTAGLIEPERRAQLKAVPNPRGSSGQSTPKPYTVAEVKHFYRDLARRYPAPPVKGPGSLLLRRYQQGKTSFQRIARMARRYQLEAMVSLALEEGLRCTEICHISLAQMHPDNDGIIVVSAKQKPGQRKEREIPFTAHSRAVVGEWLDFRASLKVDHDQPWLRLFYPDHTAPETLDHMHGGISLLGRTWSWHRFRHTYASERLRAGMPIEQLQITMGHGTISQTLAYTKIEAADIQREAERTEAQFAERLGLVA